MILKFFNLKNGIGIKGQIVRKQVRDQTSMEANKSLKVTVYPLILLVLTFIVLKGSLFLIYLLVK